MHHETFYTCPMDPDVIQGKPGKCLKCGMDLVPIPEGTDNRHSEHTSMERDFQKRFFLTLPLVLLTTLLSPNIQKWFGFYIDFGGKNVLLLLLGTVIFILGGIPFFKAAKGEIQTRNFGMMTLVTLAITAGFAFSVAATFLFPGESLYWEISTLISVFLLGHWLEMRAVRGAAGALSELAKLTPKTTHLVKNGIVSEVETSQIKIGDEVLVKPGEKIPIDGVVVDGASLVNESMITGESRPITKIKEDRVIGGTINQDGSLTIVVTKTGADTVISQIMKLIQQAQSSKPQVQQLADKAAGILTFIAIMAGTSAFVYWFFVSPHGAIFAATLAVSAVVVACNHALGLAIPTVTAITSTIGARNGILIKNMKGLEIAQKINYVIFDKTGTLTKGVFAVSDIIKVKNSKYSKDDLLKLAASVEINSQHSIANGIVTEAKKRHLQIPQVKNFTSSPGKGAKGRVNNKTITIGNKALFDEQNISLTKLREKGEKSQASTPIFIAIDNKLEGIILLTDEIRDESKQAIGRLHQMGIKTALLTGDTKDVAEEIGEKLNIDTVFSQVLPEEKVNKVKQLQQEGNIVAMVGDGVNDAPSLIQAHVGLAIGAGTDVAIESADIVLMKNNPLDVVKAISLSQKTNTKMVQNLVWATGYNIFAIPTAAGIFYTSFGILLRPEWAALLMSASSIVVVLNALLLKKTTL